ncbi:MAG: histidinol dehydrogenase [Chloroflexales bacterium]|nr:histidinol dehydrogenase [Chloroflexales bacterium]
MPIPMYTDLAAAQASVLKRVPFDEVEVTDALLDKIAARVGERLTPVQVVERIVNDVRQRGDSAVAEWSLRLDGHVPTQWLVPQERILAAWQAQPPELQQALQLAANQIRNFHSKQQHQSWMDVTSEGTMGQLVVPMERVGIYVPGGSAPLPSTLLMAAIPARVAGVAQIVVCSPVQRDSGEIADIVLAAAYVAGVDQVLRIGGAQAIAAMAFGTGQIARVDKIAGPGNLFVVLAKRMVYGAVGIESLPGPTETLVIADANANPAYVAADLLAQAEHVQAAAILVTTDMAMAQAVKDQLTRQLTALPDNSGAAETLMLRSGIVVVPDLTTAFAVANAYAPEHLCLLIDHAWDYLGWVRNAGGVFIGEQSFEVLGDYIAGPSHIMPTGGTARYASPVNVDDFRKIISVIGLNQSALQRIGPAAALLADAEGLHAHAAAVRIRLAE